MATITLPLKLLVLRKNKIKRGALLMDNTVQALATTVNAASLWGVFNSAIPFISVVVLVGFGFYLVRRMIKGVAKGKAKI